MHALFFCSLLLSLCGDRKDGVFVCGISFYKGLVSIIHTALHSVFKLSWECGGGNAKYYAGGTIEVKLCHNKKSENNVYSNCSSKEKSKQIYYQSIMEISKTI